MKRYLTVICFAILMTSCVVKDNGDFGFALWFKVAVVVLILLFIYLAISGNEIIGKNKGVLSKREIDLKVSQIIDKSLQDQSKVTKEVNHVSERDILNNLVDNTRNPQQLNNDNLEKIFFSVKGIMYRPKNVIKKISDYIKEGDELHLERDRRNKYDKYAVKVIYDFIWIESDWIGYVDRSYSKEVSELLDSGKEYSCKVSSVFTDFDYYETNNGREVEYIRYIDMHAEIGSIS